MVFKRLGSVAVLLGVLSILLIAVSVWGFRFQGWPWARSFRIAAWGVRAAFGGVLLSLSALIALRMARGSGARWLIAGLLLSLPVSALGVAFDLTARMTPPINDISTDVVDPPVFWSTQTPSDYPAANADLQREAYPEVRPLDIALPREEAFAQALSLIEDRGWDVLSADPEEGQIEAIATSPVYGFQDEVVLRIAGAGADGGSRVDMRSRSRIGLVDRGANARRITAFLADLAEGS